MPRINKGTKPLKRHEIIANLEHEIRMAKLEAEYYNSRLPKMEKQFLNLMDHNREVENSFRREIDVFHRYRDDYNELIKQKEKALSEYTKTPTKPKPQKEENGKVLCDICGKEYSPQGYPIHRKKCEFERRKEELKKKYEEELAKEQEDLELTSEGGEEESPT